MKTFFYRVHPEDGYSVKFMLTREQAKELHRQMTEDLGYDLGFDKPMEQKINFVAPPSYNERWIYMSSKTGRLFRRTSHDYDAGKTFVFNAINMTWDIDDNHLWDLEVLSGSIVLLD